MMQKSLILFLSGLLIMAIFSSISLADNPLIFMEQLYTDLADIIEDWSNNPRRCLVEVERYCKRKKKEFSKYFGLGSGGCRDCATQQFEKVSEKVPEKSLPDHQTKIFQAISRYNRVMSDFSKKHPHYGQKIIEEVTRAFKKAD